MSDPVRNPDTLARTETCYLCTKPLPETPPDRKTSIPLCNSHWSTWVAHFTTGDDIPPCAAHLIPGDEHE